MNAIVQKCTIKKEVKNQTRTFDLIWIGKDLNLKKAVL